MPHGTARWQQFPLVFLAGCPKNLMSQPGSSAAKCRLPSFVGSRAQHLTAADVPGKGLGGQKATPGRPWINASHFPSLNPSLSPLRLSWDPCQCTCSNAPAHDKKTSCLAKHLLSLVCVCNSLTIKWRSLERKHHYNTLTFFLLAPSSLPGALRCLARFLR